MGNAAVVNMTWDRREELGDCGSTEMCACGIVENDAMDVIQGEGGTLVVEMPEGVCNLSVLRCLQSLGTLRYGVTLVT